MTQYDAIVIGAGIAGCTLSIQLADAGYSVLLLEKARFPRDKVCGEGLMPYGLQMLKAMGLDSELGLQGVASAFHGVRFQTAEGERLLLDFREFGTPVSGRIVPRLSFDEGLWRMAARNPKASLLEGFQLKEVHWSPNGWRVVGSSGAEERVFAGRILVGSDGIRSRIPRRVGIGFRQGGPRRVGLRAFYPIFDGERSWVNVHCSSWGEAYVAPQAKGGAVVTYLFEAPGQRIGADMKGFLQGKLALFPDLSRDLSQSPEPERIRASSPLSTRLERSHGDRLLLIGDAGGAADPITGQGITLALRDARLATEILSDALHSDRLGIADLKKYSKERDHYFLPAYRWAGFLAQAIRRPWLVRNAFRCLSRNTSLRRKVLMMSAHGKCETPIDALDKLRMALGV